MAVAMIGPKFLAFDRNGIPLAFGKVYTYQARTNSPKPTYQSEDQKVENTNPVILNGEGYANIYLSGSYKIVLKDSDDNEIWTADPVSEASDGNGLTYVLTAYYLTSSSFKVLGDHLSVMVEGSRVEIGFITNKSKQSTVITSAFDGTFTTVEIEDSIITTDINTASLPTGMSAIADFNDISQEQLENQEQAFQDRFAFSQPVLPWAPLTLIADELQLYSTGTIGESGYSVWIANPSLLPFTTSATFAEDEAADRWSSATVSTRDYALRTSLASALNVAKDKIALSTDTAKALDDVLYIYNAITQVTYGVPTLTTTGETIVSVSVSGGELTTSTGEVYTLSNDGTRYTVDTVAELVNLPNLVGAHVTWLGYNSVSDGGGNSGVITEGTHIEDLGSIFSISDNLYVKADNKGSCNVKIFGCFGLTDDSLQLQRAITANTGKVVYSDTDLTHTIGNVYILNNSILFNINTITPAGSTDFVSGFVIDGITTAKDNIIIENVHVDGNRVNQSNIITTSEDGGRHGLRVLGNVTNLYVYKSSANYCAGDGIEIYSAGKQGLEGTYTFENIIIENCKFNWNRRHGASLDSHKGVKFINTEGRYNGQPLDNASSYTPTHGSWAAWIGAEPTVPVPSYGNGIDFEGYGEGTGFEDLLITGGNYTGNGGEGITFREPTDASTIPDFVSRKDIIISAVKLGGGAAAGLYYGLSFKGQGATFAWENVTLSSVISRGSLDLNLVYNPKIDNSNTFICAGTPVNLVGNTLMAIDSRAFDIADIDYSASNSQAENLYYVAATNVSIPAGGTATFLATTKKIDQSYSWNGGAFTPRKAGWFKVTVQHCLTVSSGLFNMYYAVNSGTSVKFVEINGHSPYQTYQNSFMVYLGIGDSLGLSYGSSATSTISGAQLLLNSIMINRVGE